MAALFRPHRIGGAAVYRPDYGAAVSFSVAPAGFAGSLAIGSPAVAFTIAGPFSVAPSGIASTLSIGAPTVSFAGGSTFSMAPSGIGSTMQLGVPAMSFLVPATFSVTPGGIGSTLAFGPASFSFQHGDSLEPVSLAEAKLAARVDVSALDDFILGAIAAARREAEHITQRVYKRRAFAFELSDWPEAGYRFAVCEPDLCSVSYYDEAGGWSALDAAAFEFAAAGSGAVMAPALDTTWPVLGRRAVGARVRVTFTAGPRSPDDVDDQVKLFIKANVAAWVNNPEAMTDKDLQLSPLLAGLLDAERLWC